MQQPPGRPVASVVVPAHDEESVILRCLTTLLRDAREGEFEVVVAANGCTDSTTDLVRSSGLPVRCLDLPAPGKIAALNAADEVCTVFPRIYLDADVLLTATAARDLAAVLDGEEPVAASPRMVVDTADCSAAVRSYYRVWTRLGFFGEGYVGSGVYALSARGHDRVAPFPAVTNDDDYVRRSFGPHERRTTPGTFAVFPARTVAALVRRGARTRAGNLELDASAPQPAPRGASAAAVAPGAARGGAAAVLPLVRDPRTWPDLLVFSLITARVRLAAVRRRRGADTGWGRDDSSRGAAAA